MYRTLYESSGDAIMVMEQVPDDVLQIVDCNEKAAELLSCSREAVKGESFENLSAAHQSSDISSKQLIAEMLTSVLIGAPQYLRWMLKSRNGIELAADISFARMDIDGRQYIQAIARVNNTHS